TGPRQITAVPSGPAPGIEHPRPTRDHRIDQPRLAHQVRPGRGHGTETLDVPGGVLGVRLGHLDPLARFGHASILPRIRTRWAASFSPRHRSRPHAGSAGTATATRSVLEPPPNRPEPPPSRLRTAPEPPASRLRTRAGSVLA